MLRRAPWGLALRAGGHQLRGGSRGLLLGAPFARKRLRQLEEDVQRQPADVGRVLALYDAANRAREHALVVRSFESAEYASDERTAKEYVKALGALGRLDRLDLAELAHALGPAGAASADVGGGRVPLGEADALRALGGGALRAGRAALRGGTGGVGGGGSSEVPIHVVLTEPWRAQLWRLARNLGVAAAIMFMITTVRQSAVGTRRPPACALTARAPLPLPLRARAGAGGARRAVARRLVGAGRRVQQRGGQAGGGLVQELRRRGGRGRGEGGAAGHCEA